MKRKHAFTSLLALGCLVSLTSCFGQLLSQVIKDDYPATPARAIHDNHRHPANNECVTVSDRELPPPAAVTRGGLTYHADGLPYAFPTGYKNVVLSPYPPNNPINFSGMKAHDKAWDPYTRKPFHIPAVMQWN